MSKRAPHLDPAGRPDIGAMVADIAEDLRALRDGRLFGIVRDYTPTWASASNPQPAVGDGTLVGRWALTGKLLWVNIALTVGTTTTFGTGAWWSFSLPTGFTARTATGSQTVAASAINTGVANYVGAGLVPPGDDIVYAVGDGVNWTETVPFTWGSTDVLSITGTIEVA